MVDCVVAIKLTNCDLCEVNSSAIIIVTHTAESIALYINKLINACCYVCRKGRKCHAVFGTTDVRS